MRTTSITKVPDAQLTTANDTRLVVAGGGGGGSAAWCGPQRFGSAGDTTVTGAGYGGNGGSQCEAPPVGNGGFGGTQGGTGGAASRSLLCGGDNGLLGQGGPAPANCDDLGGGGGGGYYGGGGAGYGLAAGGGGGAGSSFWAPGATGTSMSTDTTGTPEVTITPVIPAATTTTVSAPATGTAGTAIAASTVSATLSGAASGAGGTITYTVFGSQPAPPSDCTSGGTTVGTANVSGNGTYNPSAGYTPGGAGTYWWYASYSGDSSNAASNSGCGTGMATTAVAAAPPPGLRGHACRAKSHRSVAIAGRSMPEITGVRPGRLGAQPGRRPAAQAGLA